MWVPHENLPERHQPLSVPPGVLSPSQLYLFASPGDQALTRTYPQGAAGSPSTCPEATVLASELVPSVLDPIPTPTPPPKLTTSLPANPPIWDNILDFVSQPTELELES